MVLTLFWIRIDGLGAFLDQGWWFGRFSGSGFVVLTLSWIRVRNFDESVD